MLKLAIACTYLLIIFSSFVLADQPLKPDPTAVETRVFPIANDPGHFVPRVADLFLDDGTDFDAPVGVPVTTTSPAFLRALHPYNMDLDPLFDNVTKLTRPDAETPLENCIIVQLQPPAPPQTVPVCGPTTRPSNLGDSVLYIDLAVFYDDNEKDRRGGFWANWKIEVEPLDLSDGSFGRDVGEEFLRFKTPLRGPFWSGEKLEVGDTENGARPQVMHYENFGIWNWNWSSHDAVRVFIKEGDGTVPVIGTEIFDSIALFIVRRDETTQGPLTVADTGDLVSLALTDDSRFKRTVLDDSGKDSDDFPRVLGNPDGHDVDLVFRTRPLQPPPDPDIQFSDKYVVGPNRLKGPEEQGNFPWKPFPFTQGPQRLRYIDNINYTPGWDCEALFNPLEPRPDPFDVDDDFEFFIMPGLDDVFAMTARGGCDGTTTLFFRSSEVFLPQQVSMRSIPRTRISNGETISLTIPRDPQKNGISFSEFLGYETNGDDDFGFSINKSISPSDYNFEVSTFDGNSGSGIEIQTTVLEWPSCLPGFVNNTFLSTILARTGFAHTISDLPIPRPTEEYFFVNEILTYDPDSDDDMSWSLYFEPLPSHVNVQLATSNAGNENAFAEANSLIVQFPVELGFPEAKPMASESIVETSFPEGEIIHFNGLGSLANKKPGVSEDSIVKYEWRDTNGAVVGTTAETDLQLTFGDAERMVHEIKLHVEDQCGFSDEKSVFVEVQRKEPVCGDGILDFSEECDDGDPDNSDGCLTTCQLDTDFDSVADDTDICPDSDLSPRVIIGSCDSGVTNFLDNEGCAISDRVAECALASTDQKEFAKCVAQLTNTLIRADVIKGKQKGAIKKCARQADIP